MKDGTCPKCGTTHVYVSPGTPNAVNTLTIGELQEAPLEVYACTRCGYVEQYLLDLKARRAIATGWARAQELATRKRGEEPQSSARVATEPSPGFERLRARLAPEAQTVSRTEQKRQLRLLNAISVIVIGGMFAVLSLLLLTI